jgi:hypothetical protein
MEANDWINFKGSTVHWFFNSGLGPVLHSNAEKGYAGHNEYRDHQF